MVGASIATIRVDGTLSFDPPRNTELRVDTVVVSSQGTFQMGTAAAPIAPGVQARLLITGASAIDRQWDPFGISRGLDQPWQSVDSWCRNQFDCGPGRPGECGRNAALQLKSAPVGWRVGDSLAIAGTATGTEQNEVRRNHLDSKATRSNLISRCRSPTRPRLQIWTSTWLISLEMR